MQVLESVDSNNGLISSHIKLAIDRVAFKFCNSNTDGVDFEELFKIYHDTLKLLVNFIDVDISGIDLITPLFTIIRTHDLMNGKKVDFLCLLAMFIFAGLLNQTSYERTRAFITQDQFKLELPGFIECLDNEHRRLSLSTCSSIIMLNGLVILVDMLPSLGFKGMIYGICSNSFKFLSVDIYTIFSCMDELKDIIKDQDKFDLAAGDKLLKSLEAVVNSVLSYGNTEVALVCIINSKLVNKWNWLLTKPLSYSASTSCKVLNHLTIEMLSNNFYNTKVLTNQYLSTNFKSNEIQISQLELSDNNLSFAIQHLLYVLDGSAHLDNRIILIYTNWALTLILSYCQLKFGKLNLYSIFNKLKPKHSFVSSIQMVNFQLLNLAFKYDKVPIPGKLALILAQSRLPPFPKPSYWSDEFNNNNPLDFDLTAMDSNVELIDLNIIKSLKLLSMFTNDDIMSFEPMENTNLYKRIIITKLETLVTTLMLNQYVFMNFRKTSLVNKEMVQFSVAKILSELLRTDFGTPNMSQPITWIIILTSLINFVAGDLKYLDGLNSLITIILAEFENDPIINDPVIKSIICDFSIKYNTNLSSYQRLGVYTGQISEINISNSPRSPTGTIDSISPIPNDELRAVKVRGYPDIPHSADDSVSSYLTGLNLNKKGSFQSCSIPNSNSNFNLAANPKSQYLLPAKPSVSKFTREQGLLSNFQANIQLNPPLFDKGSNSDRGRHQSVHIDDFIN